MPVHNAILLKNTNDGTPSNWKQELSQAITSPTQLISELGLKNELSSTIIENPEFKCLVPRPYLGKIKYQDINDPLLKQVLPIIDENYTTGSHNPVGDLEAIADGGLLHKYHGRALLISTAACAVHCRYCFRRHYPYAQASYKSANIDKVLKYLKKHAEIDEIILSGGDPLVLDDTKLGQLISQLENIESLSSLRIHTRLPLVLPSRITPELLSCFSNSRFRITMVIHSNHANELGGDEHRVLERLHRSGVTLLNQSVLLTGINDNATTLSQLSKRLHTCFTLPYYLHLLDPVQGAMHFDCSQTIALQLIEKLQSQLPGYLVPKLVREIAGNHSKTAIFSI